MSSIGYRLKSKENKQVSIYVYLRPPNSKVISTRTGLTVNPSDWSKSKKRVLIWNTKKETKDIIGLNGGIISEVKKTKTSKTRLFYRKGK